MKDTGQTVDMVTIRPTGYANKNDRPSRTSLYARLVLTGQCTMELSEAVSYRLELATREI
jgi:hypothetical protein